MNSIIAIPSGNPGGLEAPIGEHFGHCEMYTLVTIENGNIAKVDVIPNVPHEHGGCMAPVQHLAQNGVRQLIAGGMGLRPLMGFNQVGIDVFHSGGSETVGQAVTSMLAGRLPQFSQNQTCGGCAE